MLPSIIAVRIPRDWKSVTPDPDWWRDPALQDALGACREATRRHATSFFFSSLALPRDKKQASFAVYAYCRWIDDVIDESPDPSRIDEEAMRRETRAILAGTSDLPFAPAMAAVARHYGVDAPLCDALIHGCCLDRQPLKLQTRDQLYDYCYHVASVVGLMMCRVFGMNDAAGAPHALAMGLAMQLTNILRDVAEDYRKGRIYLPLDVLAKRGLDEQTIARAEAGAPWQTLIADLIAETRGYYRYAEEGLRYLPDDGSRFTARLMGRVYGGILGKIEAVQGNVFAGRVYVPTSGKLVILARSLFG